jgi:ABC-2 type transport system permease protein
VGIVFSIFKGAQIGYLRDRPLLLFLIAFPVLMVFILGTLLANLDNPDATIEPFELAYLIESDEPATVQTAEAIIGQFEDVEQFDFVEGGSLASIKERIESGEIGGAVVFVDPFAIEIHEGSDLIKNRAMRTMFEGVARLHGAMTVAMSQAPGAGGAGGAGASDAAGAGAGLPDGGAGEPGAPGGLPLDSVGSQLNFEELPVRVEERSYGVSRTMLDYYAITMIVMMFFMGSATTAASTFYHQRKDGTLRRVMASPLSRVSVYLQTLLSGIPLGLAQVGLVMLASTVLFGAHYAATWQLNVLLFVMLSVASIAISSLFLALGILIRVNPVVVILPLMWVLLFISGTFSKEVFIPGVTERSPVFFLQTAAFDLTLFGHTGLMVVVLLVSLALIVLSTVAGVALISRKDVAS